MRIKSLVPSQKVQGRWVLTWEDGTSLKITDGEMVDFSLHAGLDLPPEEADRLKDAAALARTKRRAANILSARPLSRRELEKRLTEKGESPHHAALACDYLERLGYLDDGAYAHTLARYYGERGYGPKRLREELYRRGVPRDYWEDALADLDTPEDTLDKLVAAKLRRVEHPDRKDLKRTADYLLRRGYGWSEVSAALRRYEDSCEDWGNDAI